MEGAVATSAGGVADGSSTGGFSDQFIGLTLAISSSAFIGASFIIKKKGLQKAGSTGLRAGAKPP